MAYDKVVDSTVLEDGLTQIADAIREKGGLGDLFTSPLTFPSGFASAVEGLSGGGATEPYVEETYDMYGNMTSAVMHGHSVVRSFAFYYQGITSIELPDTVYRIENSAFYSCTKLTSIVLSANLTTIDNQAFYDCLRLSQISFPSQLGMIDDQAFYGCTALESIIFPAMIKTINSMAFFKCKNLETVTFQGTPTGIASSAFSSCEKLTTINVPWAEGAVANAPWGATGATIHYNVSGV